MKVKLSFDRNAIQEFLLDNVEKIVFAGVGVCFLLIIYYGAMGRESFKRTARELEERTIETKNHIGKPREENTCVAHDYAVPAGSRNRVEEKLYETVVWSPVIFRPLEFRDRPPVKPVEDLVGAAGRGAMGKGGAGGGRAGDSRTQGRRWIVLTGVVPQKDQIKAFTEALEGAGTSGPGAEVPVYRYFYVQRAEVSGNGSVDPAKLKWVSLDMEAAARRLAELDSGRGESQLEQGFRNPVTTQPLPARYDQPWGPEILHARLVGPPFDLVCRDPDAYKGQQVTWLGEFSNPDSSQTGKSYAVFRYVRGMDVRRSAGPSLAEGEYFAVETANPEAVSTRSNLTGITGTVQGKVRVKVDVSGTGAGGRRGMRGSRQPAAGPDEVAETHNETVPVLKAELRDLEATPERLAPGSELMQDPGKAPTETPLATTPDQPGSRRRAATSEAAADADYLLFRFFDFDVEPGKQYCYRVQLLLINPNLKQDQQKLAIPGDSKEPFLPVKEDLADPKNWSKPSPVIGVPADVQVLALGVNPALRLGADPSATIGIVKWVEKDGREAPAKFPGPKDASCSRGTVLDFGERTVSPESQGESGAGTTRPQPAAEVRPRTPPPTGERTPPRAAPGERTPPRTKAGSRNTSDDLLLDRERGRVRAAQPVEFKATFDTGAVLLDIRGGEKLPGKDRSATQPGEILVLSADGKLQIRNEIDDKAEYDRVSAAASTGLMEGMGGVGGPGPPRRGRGRNVGPE